MDQRFLLPAAVVYACRPNQKTSEIDRPIDKQIEGTEIKLEEQTINRDSSDIRFVAGELGDLLTTPKMSDTGADISGVTPQSSAGGKDAQDEEEEAILARIPVSYRPKAQGILRTWVNKGMSWDEDGIIYLKGERVKGVALKPLLHHAASRSHRIPPAGYKTVLNYMQSENVSRTVYGNLWWRLWLGDKDQPPAPLPTVIPDSVGWKDLDLDVIEVDEEPFGKPKKRWEHQHSAPRL